MLAKVDIEGTGEVREKYAFEIVIGSQNLIIRRNGNRIMRARRRKFSSVVGNCATCPK